jgi:hypothetical protein
MELQSDEGLDVADSLPMPKELFEELFNRLDKKLEEQGCNYTLNITLEFLASKGISVNNIVEWLKEHGGYYDCEVLANVEDYF